jgi:hypothetical protein
MPVDNFAGPLVETGGGRLYSRSHGL